MPKPASCWSGYSGGNLDSDYRMTWIRNALSFARNWHIGQVVVVWIVCGVAIASLLKVRAAADARLAAAWESNDAAFQRRWEHSDEVWQQARFGFADPYSVAACPLSDRECRLIARTNIPPVIVRAHFAHIERRLRERDMTPMFLLKSDSLIRRGYATLADSATASWSAQLDSLTRYSREAHERSSAFVSRTVSSTILHTRIADVGIVLFSLLALTTLWSWSAGRARAG